MFLSRKSAPLKSAPLLGLAALAALGLAALPQAARAQSSIDTTPTANGSGISPWGLTDTSTYGQTFTATSSNVLTDFTFYLGQSGTPIKYGAYVYAWDGSKAAGPALFSSGAQTYTSGPSAFTALTTSTGGTTLTAGQKYVAFLSTAGMQAGQPNATVNWEVAGNYANAYSGGDFVYYNTGNNFASLTSSGWDDQGYANGGAMDAAFKMDFANALPVAAAATPAPEPSSVAAFAFTGLFAAGLVLKARKRTGVAA